MPNQELENYWGTVVETMMDALMIVDTDGLIVSVNKAMTELTGYEREELIGHPCSKLRCDSCKGVQSVSTSRHCALFHTGTVSKLTCSVRLKDGHQAAVLKNAKVLRNDSGQVIGGVETLTDLREIAAREEVIRKLKKELGVSQDFQGMVGHSPVMRNLFDLISSAAQTQAPVLIQGPSGTGKELVAEAIHRLGQRPEGPFIKVNCAALNQSLLESELFGHVQGAFTGADRNRIGRFEAADGGDLFLDEIGDLPLETQVKLLRVLQEREIERVGSNQTIGIDVRFICATNQDLGGLMDKGLFRSDLFYRINVLPINVPALKDRGEDIPLLANSFLNRLGALNNRKNGGITTKALNLLAAYHWPGNVRELMNVIEYSLVSSQSGPIRPEHLPPYVSQQPDQPLVHKPRIKTTDAKISSAEQALAQTGGNKKRAAELLGVSRTTLWRWLQLKQ